MTHYIIHDGTGVHAGGETQEDAWDGIEKNAEGEPPRNLRLCEATPRLAKKADAGEKLLNGSDWAFYGGVADLKAGHG